MTEKTRRRVALLTSLIASGLALGGCVSSPTYGTDKTATEQLVGDVTGILSIGPKDREKIDYKPRPELVRPTSDQTRNLPAPQDSIAATRSDAWPESPEQRRARLRADATANRDKPGWRPEVEADMPTAASSASRTPFGTSRRFADSGVEAPENKEKQREAFNKRLAETRQGSETTRKYLSEPPLVYRQPAEGAPVGDVGEDELKKERRLKAQARKGGKSWRDMLPW